MFFEHGSRRFIIMADVYYCVKCKKKTEMKNAQQITMKNGKPALKGQCAVCGTTVNAILGSAKK
jgi:hypothetical protein